MSLAPAAVPGTWIYSIVAYRVTDVICFGLCTGCLDFFFSDDKDDTDYFSFELLLVWETNFLCGSLILRRVDPKARGDCGEICNNLWMCVRPTPI